MMRHHLAKAFAAAALLMLAQPVLAEQEGDSGEASFLNSLKGRFSGNGTL
jgi:hypothetical protein